MKTIKSKLMALLGTMTFLMCVVLGIVIFGVATVTVGSTIRRDLKEVALQKADSIEYFIEKNIVVMEALASREDIASPDVKVSEKVKVLASEVERIGCENIGYADVNGNLFDKDGKTIDISSREYFQKALQGENVVTDPFLNSAGDDVEIVYAVPVTYNGTIVGVLAQQVDGNQLSDIVNDQNMGESGVSYITNKEGTVIAHADNQLVNQLYNPITSGDNETFAETVKAMASGEVSVSLYKYNGEQIYSGYAPIEGTNWAVGVGMDKEEIFEDLTTLFYFIVMICLICTLISLVIIYYISKSISKKIISTSERLNTIASGNLVVEVPERFLSSKDEIGTMARSMKAMQESISQIVLSIRGNSNSLADKSSELSTDSEEISKLSDTISKAIAEIAEGTSVQSNELVSITSVLDEFNNRLKEMSAQIDSVDNASRKIDTMANKSNEEMTELNSSVENIKATFDNFEKSIGTLGNSITEIHNITNMITQVANQTNLLALNASIEAARAGEAGKGFAVVAEEISNLAEQSRVSSANITSLITGISKEAEDLVKDAANMGEELGGQVETIHRSIHTFSNIINEVSEVIPMIKQVKDTADEINHSKNNILTKIDEISSVSEEICASSEEIAASTDEMNLSIRNVADSAKHLNGMTDDMVKQVETFVVE